MTDTLSADASATLTIDEVAIRYRTSRDTIYRWLRGSNDFPRPIPLPSRGVRWTIAQLEQWENREIERANGAVAA